MVVVEDDDHAAVFLADLVQSFQRHAGFQRAVADDRNHFVGLLVKIAGDGHTQSRG